MTSVRLIARVRANGSGYEVFATYTQNVADRAPRHPVRGTVEGTRQFGTIWEHQLVLGTVKNSTALPRPHPQGRLRKCRNLRRTAFSTHPPDLQPPRRPPLPVRATTEGVNMLERKTGGHRKIQPFRLS